MVKIKPLLLLQKKYAAVDNPGSTSRKSSLDHHHNSGNNKRFSLGDTTGNRRLSIDDQGLRRFSLNNNERSRFSNDTHATTWDIDRIRVRNDKGHYSALMSDSQDLSGLVVRDATLKRFIRGLKFFSRSLSLACSTVVIGLSATSFHIFLSTRTLPAAAGITPWATPTLLWPQILTLCIASLSFAASSFVLASYVRGHTRAEQFSWLITAMSVGGIIVAIVLWSAAGASMQAWRSNQRGRDLWGWACDKKSDHVKVFGGEVNYTLVCKLQNWNFVCAVIHICSESVAILVYAFSAWRLWGKMSMAKGKGGHA